MAKTAVTADSSQLQQQKILMYVMPLFLAVISFNFPMGVLLYWVTTNVWQIAQQAIILYEVEHDAPPENGGNGAAGKANPAQPSAGSKPSGKAGNKGPVKASDKGSSTSGKNTPRGKGPKKASGTSSSGAGKGSSNGKPSRQRRPGNGGSPAKGSPGHIPSRRSRRERE